MSEVRVKQEKVDGLLQERGVLSRQNIDAAIMNLSGVTAFFGGITTFLFAPLAAFDIADQRRRRRSGD